MMAYQPLRVLGRMTTRIQEGLAAADRVFHLLDQAPKIVDKPGATNLPREAGAVRFDGVMLSYSGEARALDGVTFEAPAGKTTALVGPSGAGKSSVLNLIPRFYEVDAGRVLVNGSDVRDVTLDSLRGAIALVSQEVVLFDDTVANNIRYGNWDASDSAVWAAAEAAAAVDFINALPRGYDTVVGEQGLRLSGGQRQRIAIARAILKDAPILLLDEATSALDTESERQIQRALATLMSGRTTIVIAHRLSTVVNADMIHVMEEGTVVQSGQHRQLLAKGGLYAHLHALQFAERHEPVLGQT
jgi:ATP-binding cassette, subfamily B, bacterial MsbA